MGPGGALQVEVADDIRGELPADAAPVGVQDGSIPPVHIDRIAGAEQFDDAESAQVACPAAEAVAVEDHMGHGGPVDRDDDLGMSAQAHLLADGDVLEIEFVESSPGEEVGHLVLIEDPPSALPGDEDPLRGGIEGRPGKGHPGEDLGGESEARVRAAVQQLAPTCVVT